MSDGRKQKVPSGNKTIFYSILIVVGFLGIMDTVILVPFMPGVDAGLIMPAVLGILFIVFSILKLKTKEPLIRNKTMRIAVVTVVLVGIMFFITIEGFIAYHAVKQVETDVKVDFIMVPGCGVFPDGSLTLTLKNRLDAALDYSLENSNAIFVVTGGQGPREPVPEAMAMRDYLVSQGVPEGKILTESESTSTNENMKFSAQLIKERYGETGMKTAIATSDFHMFRSKLLAAHYGFVPYGIPGETPWYIRLNCYLREFLAVIKTFIFDIWLSK